MKTRNSFALRKFPRILSTSVAALVAGMVFHHHAQAATVFWDLNGTNAGAVDVAGPAPGIWDAANTFWNSVADGTGATAAWLAGDTATFSAGTNATGTFTITVSGTHDIGGLVFEEGTITLDGGTLNWSVAGALNATTGSIQTINSTMTGSAAITRGTSGTIIIGANNTGFSGTVNLTGGVTRILADDGLGTNTITLGGTAAVLELGDGVTFDNALVVSNNGNEKTIRAFAGASVVNSVITQSENTTLGNFRLEALTGATLTVNSNIGGTVAGLRTLGAGTKILTGNNTYTGNTQILGGITTFSAANNLGDTSTVATIQIGTSTTGATLNYIGAGDSIADAISLNGTSGGTAISSNGTGAVVFSNTAAIVAGAGSKTFTLTGSNTDANRIDGIIQNNSATNVTNLSKTGAGLWVLTAANTYNNTTINGNGGILRLTGAGTLGTAALTVNAGTLDVAGTANQSITNLTMGGGAEGSSATIMLGAGRSLILGGTVTFSSTDSNLTSTITGDAGAILDFGGAGRTFTIGDSANASPDMLIGANVTLQNDAGGGLTKAGAGTLQIDGTINLTGPVTVTGGAFQGTNTGNLVLNGGVFQGSGTFNRALGSGANQVQFGAAGGGFAAAGGPLTVTFAGAPDPLVWGTTPFFVPTGAPLIFGSTSANDVVTFTHSIDLNDTGAALSRTVSVVDNTAVTTDKAVLSGVLSNSGFPGGLTKTGNGVLELAGANTFTGPLTVTGGGTLQFSTVSDNGGGPSNLGQGTDGISLGGGTLSFIGDGVVNSESTNRAINLTANSTLAANGTNGATITYAGAITTAVGNFTVILGGTGSGIVTGGITVTPPASGTISGDLTIASGDWRITGANSTIADDLLQNGGTLTLDNTVVNVGDDTVITGATTVLNLNTTGVLNGLSATNAGLFARSGGVVNFNANEVANVDFLNMDSGLGTVNTNGFNLTLPWIELGDDAAIDIGVITGNGTLTVTYTGVDYLQGLRLANGSIAANLAGVAALLKYSPFDVTLSGDNSGLTGTVAATRLDAGNLILDYTTQNNNKISSEVALDLRGGTLTVNGNTSAATTQSVASMTLVNGGANKIDVNSGGPSATLNLGLITRLISDGTIRFETPLAGAITTTSVNTNGLLGAWATVTNADGVTGFAANDGSGNIVVAASTVSDNVALWPIDANVTDSTGYTGTLAFTRSLKSVRFNGSGASTVTIDADEILNIESGGILLTSSIGGAAAILGGTLTTGTGEVIITQDSTAQSLTISSAIGGTQALTKTGNGTLILSGNNTYSGITELQAGTIILQGGNAIGDTSVVNLPNDHDALLQLTANETIRALTGGTNTLYSTVVDIGSFTLTLNPNATSVYAGLLTGNGTLVKNGGNNQELEGDNTGFTGTVIVNQGLLHLDSGSGAITGATSITLNGPTASVLSDQDQDAGEDRIGNDATITLNNTAGGNGLRIRNETENATRTENVGAIILGVGHNAILAEANTGTGTGTATVADLLANTLTRNNRATVLVRGLSLGTAPAGARKGYIRFDSGATATLDGFEVGGGGLITTPNISIIPFMVGDVTTAGLGNSFVTYTDGTSGLRPLAEGEYTTNAAGFDALPAAAPSTNNVRFTTGATLTGTATAINSLVIDAATGQTVNGPASPIEITSGAILAASTGTNTAHALGGFSAITTGGGRDYTIFVTSTTGTLTISSPLTGVVPLVKSGAGTLVLTGVGNAIDEIYLNQGLVQIDDLDKLGTAPALNFFGGGIQTGAAFVDDLSSKPWDIRGSGTLDVSLTTSAAGGTLTNGIDDSSAPAADAPVETMTFITRSSATTGLLTINGSSSFTGTTIFNHGSVNSGLTNSVVLNGATNATISGDVHIGSIGTINTSSFDIVVALGANEQIVDTASITFRGTDGEQAYFKLLGFTETVAGISDTTSEGVVENVESTDAGVTTNGKLIVNSANDFSFNGFMRNRGTGTNATMLEFEKQGTGTQTLGGTTTAIGNQITYTGATTVSGGTLRLLNTTAFASNITNNSRVVLEPTTGVSWTLAAGITGSGSLAKMGNGTLNLSGTNKDYTGATEADAGLLLVTGSLSGTTSVSVDDGGTLGGTGSINTAATVTVAPGGTLAPGASIGTLSTGPVSLVSQSNFALEINTTATTTDVLAITGNLSLANSNDVVLTISDLLEAPITTGTFKFITYTAGGWNGGLFTYGGNVIADDGFLTVGSNTFQLDYNLDNNSVALLAVIPEPGALTSLLGGLGMLIGLQRFRRRQQS